MIATVPFALNFELRYWHGFVPLSEVLDCTVEVNRQNVYDAVGYVFL